MSDLRVQRRKTKNARGQGVVEYAGALVIAATIVAMGLTVLPPNLAGMVQGIASQILGFLLSHMPT